MNLWEEELITEILLFWITIPGHPSDGLVKLEVGNSIPAFWMTSLTPPTQGNSMLQDLSQVLCNIQKIISSL